MFVGSHKLQNTAVENRHFVFTVWEVQILKTLGSKRTTKNTRTNGGVQTGRVLGNGVQFKNGIFI